MFKLKKHILRVVLILLICLVGVEANYLNTQSKDIIINKSVAGNYEEGSKIDSSNIKEYKDTVKENTEISSNTVDETQTKSVENKTTLAKPVEKKTTIAKPVENKTTAAKTKKNKSPVGTPIKAELTAYCSDPRCTGGKSDSKTAMQTKARLGVIAAPSNISLGSNVYIPELKNYKADGVFSVEDRGGAIKVKKDGTYVIDVWVPTHEEAIKFGRKKTTIYLM